mgnify:CR=1 FL=1|tara:strand:- start:184 stop:1152 length:969 start_codon:yes stop_codon:yes gene_type:complete
MKPYQEVRVIDSHTAGEPTRIVISGGPNLGNGPLSTRRAKFQSDFDWFRSATMNEPRGSEVIVGGLLCEPYFDDCVAGVIFFNNVGYIGMCGHGTIGLISTLAFLGEIQPGVHQIDTPVGVVKAELLASGEVTVINVPSYCHRNNVEVELDNGEIVTGDISWGGNWFFLVEAPEFDYSIAGIPSLTTYAKQIRKAIDNSGITGRNNQRIDHIELFAPPHSNDSHSRNFVLCPGGAYDRSPCGTGTSAKIATLYESGQIREGELWRQESIIGSTFDARVNLVNGQIIPSITGTAFVTADSKLILDPRDPYVHGIASSTCLTSP